MVDGVINKCMRKGSDRDSFNWPHTNNVSLYKKQNFLKVLEHHTIPTNSRDDYKLHEDDFDSANVLLRKH